MKTNQLMLNSFKNSMKFNKKNLSGTFLMALVSFLLQSVSLKATHLAGADLTYKRLSGNTYEFTVSLIRDCDGVAAPQTVSLNYKSITCGINNNVTLNPIAGTGQEITFPCVGTQTECNGGTLPGYQQWVYRGTANLSACTDWIFSYEICCRNCDINTITHSVNCANDPGMYVEATLNNIAGPNNSSPAFTNLPLAFLCLNQNFNYNHGAVDGDLISDSLAYSFIAPRTAAGTNVNFVAGYSATNFLTSSSAIIINPVTGEVNMTPSNVSEVGITSILVREFRNGVQIGSVVRDFQFRITDCFPNVIPTVTGINGTTNTTAYFCPGVQSCFNMLSNDANAGQIVTMTWNNGIAPPASFTTAGSPHPTGTFCWTPTQADVQSQPYTFTVTVRDDNCPQNGFQNRSFSIYVQVPTPTITGTTTFCQGSSSQLDAGSGYSGYNWSTGASTQNINVSTASLFTVTVTDANGCTGSTSAATSLYPTPTCAITGDLFYCQGSSTQICAPLGLSAYIWNTGATTRCITATAGNFTVTVTDGNGCTSSCTAQVTARPLPVCSITGSGSVCQGGSAQWCAAAAPGGFTYSYLWSTGATTQCITVNTAATYAVSITDQYGCSSSCNKTFSVNQLPNCLISGNSSICSGSSTQWCAPAGLSAYNWSTGATTQCITVNTANTFTVTVTDANGCSSSCNKSLTVFAPVNCAITGNLFYCQGSSTQLCAPAGLSSYIWNTGATTQCVTVIAGNYTLTVTDGNGCTSSCTAQVTARPLPVCSITGPGSVCQGGSTQWCAAAAPGGFTYSYLWSTGATTQCITVNTAATYTVTLTDQFGCSSSCNNTLVVNQVTSCSISGNGSVCSGNSTQWCAPAGLSSYLWNTGATTQCITVSTAGTYAVTTTNSSGCISNCSKTLSVNSLPGCLISGSSSVCSGSSTQWCAPAGPGVYLWSTGATTQCITVSQGGTYTVTTTNTSGCTSSCNKTLTISALPSCLISGNSSVCAGKSTQWCAPGGQSAYLWSTGATTQCLTLNTAGTYTVTVTKGNGCTSSCTKTLTVNPLPVCQISGNGSICAGSSTQWCAATASSYLWSTGATTQCITVSQAATYTVTTTNANGCKSSCNKSLTISALPTCLINGNTSVCAGKSTQWCAPGGQSAYLWSTGATKQCISLNTAGTYTVTVTKGNGCTSSCSQTLTVNPLPVCLITGNSSVCAGSSTQWCAATASSYLWSNGATTQCVTVSQAGTYSVTTTNSNGCTSICNKTLVVNALPNTNLTGSGNVCQGNSTQLCAGSGFTYLWTGGKTSQCIAVNVAGNYTVTVTDGNGCTKTGSKLVTVYPYPNCAINGKNSFCDGVPEEFCAPFGNNTYSWNTGATTDCIFVNAAGSYTVTVTNAGGCSSTCSKPITFVSNPPCTITGSSTICQGQTISLCGPSGTGYLYNWSTGASTQCINVSNGGAYTLTVSKGLCKSTCTKVVTLSTPSCSITGNLNPPPGQSTSICAPIGLTYQWSSGKTNRCITVINPGTYTVTVTNTSGCTSSCSAVVTSGAKASEPGYYLDGSMGYIVSNAYPNPFNSNVTIEFENPYGASHVTIELYSLEGNRVTKLFDDNIEQSIIYKINYKADQLADGIYIYRIISGNQVINKKLILMR